MNTKSRSCSSETCDFSGTYADLRKHARNVHPFARPSEADPERQRDWRRMERQMDFGDLLSTLRSAFGEDRAEDITRVLSTAGGGVGLTLFMHVLVYPSRQGLRRSSLSGGSPARAEVTVRRRLTLFFHILVYPSGHSLRSSFSRGSPARVEVTVMRRSTVRLIGEIYDGESRDDDNESSDGVESGSGPHSSN
nr:hypothetical protein [Tanacetum cinerariifolium]